MAIDRYENLPAIISELQDGAFKIIVNNNDPSVLILGTAAKGVSGKPIQAVKAQEAEARFGLEGTLTRGMYEAGSGGATNIYQMRIGAKSAILYGVGTDDMVLEPTSIETLLKDEDASNLYSVRYTNPITLGPAALVGRLQVKNAIGQIIFDNNPGSQPIDRGEVMVLGSFTAGVNIGDQADSSDFVTFKSLASDRTEVTDTFPIHTVDGTDTFLAATPALASYTLSKAPIAGTVHVSLDGVDQGALFAVLDSVVTLTTPGDADGKEVVITYDALGAGLASYTLSEESVAGSVKVLLDEVDQDGLFSVTEDVVTLDVPGSAAGKEVVITYEYDANTSINLREGSDGLSLSHMELYEALDYAYTEIETQDFKQIVPMGALLDAKNLADGDLAILASDEKLPSNQRYPVAGSQGDVLGKLFKEDFEGEVFYFWDINNDGFAEIYPKVGAASSGFKISGERLTAGDFKEVNFAHQLANACFVNSSNEYNVTGIIGTSLPTSMSTKDIATWIGKEPILDTEDGIVVNGTGLLGNKHMVGRQDYKPGFFATESGILAGAAAEGVGGVMFDRGAKPIDIGRFISVYSHPHVFFNPTDKTGFGYITNGAPYYAGIVSSLIPQSAPTNKVAQNADSLVRLAKVKLDALAKYHFVALKQKNRVFRISDAPTAARPTSDFVRLSTVRVVDRIIDIIREVGEPYIGEANNTQARLSLETNIRTRLSIEVRNNLISRFEIKVSATPTQRIQGDCDVELVIVPPFEMRKIRIFTSLSRE